ncbi:hypothetical protein FSP39_021096 [Pinctada imbricata]|uniref:C1q domain-containing protein n=1 Tax=Pinctada imbricata TaxID=66713 RepID=A0AA88Y6I9_PINIB|nr:hypothetical protein FSP39_021096 [Pinctada imbricata]
MWILKNSKELLEHLKSTHFSRVHSIKAFDFSTLYSIIPHSKLKVRLATIISNAFTSKNGNRKYKSIVVNYKKTYFVKEKSDSENKYTEIDIVQMLNFLIDIIFVVFGRKVFQQIVGIPMGTSCVPLLADIFLYSYEAEFIQSLESEGKRYLASDVNFTCRYIDDVLTINNPKFADYLSSIYPLELEVKETTETNNSASYLDIMLSYDTDGHMNTSLYDKRDDFNFSIINFPFLSSNIPSSPAYGVFISQLIRYARASPCSSTRRIYFSAYLTRHVSSSELKNNQSIVFTDVQTNEGGGYNSKTGEFTAPISGTYTFFWEFLVFPGGTIGLELQKNYKKFQHNYAHGSDSKYEVGSKSTIMNLVKGDKVRVVYVGGAGKIYGNHRYTGFSGIFL